MAPLRPPTQHGLHTQCMPHFRLNPLKLLRCFSVVFRNTCLQPRVSSKIMFDFFKLILLSYSDQVCVLRQPLEGRSDPHLQWAIDPASSGLCVSCKHTSVCADIVMQSCSIPCLLAYTMSTDCSCFSPLLPVHLVDVFRFLPNDAACLPCLKSVSCASRWKGGATRTCSGRSIQLPVACVCHVSIHPYVLTF